ncbi:MAG: polysaccharide biosynthesis protein [Owenweeksia sp.]|nr:polysaccharide biosynthesis protein [Owenweeksia sp.]
MDRGGPITVTDKKITRYFMTIPEACNLVLEAGAMGKGGGEIFVFDMGQSVKIYDLARKMVKLSGLEVDKDIEIREVGLRPGEKLHEELLAIRENTKKTYHPKIMIAQVDEYAFKTVKQQFALLESCLDDTENLEFIRASSNWCPSISVITRFLPALI